MVYLNPEVVKFDKTHYSSLVALYLTNNKGDNPNLEQLPKLGYVAYIFDQPIAAGFLRMVEGELAQIDSLVSNKDFPSETRHAGITAVVDRLIQDAKNLKLKALFATTSDSGILSRAEKLNFKVINQTIIGIKLI